MAKSKAVLPDLSKYMEPKFPITPNYAWRIVA